MACDMEKERMRRFYMSEKKMSQNPKMRILVSIIQKACRKKTVKRFGAQEGTPMAERDFDT